MKLLRLLGLALLVILLTRLDWKHALNVLTRAQAEWILASGMASLVFILLKAVRWNLLLRVQHVHYTWRRAVPVYLAGSFFSVVTPGRVGDFIKVAYLERDLGLPKPLGVPSILGDRFLDLACLLCVAMVLALVGDMPAHFRWPIITLGALAGVGVIALGCGVFTSALATTRRVLHGRRGGRLIAKLEEIVESARELLHLRSAGAAAVSLLAHGANYTAGYALATGLGLSLTPLECIYAITLSSLVALLPISVSGVGTRDVAMVMIFADWNRPGEQALAFSLGYLAINLLFANGPGAIFWMILPDRRRTASSTSVT